MPSSSPRTAAPETAVIAQQERRPLCEKADLPQHACMIPIDTFRSDAAVTELNHDDEINFDTALRRLDTRQKPIHPLVVRERSAQLVHELIITDNAVERRHLLIFGPSGNEHVAI